MKAVQINSYGGIDVLEINENAPKPSVGQDQVLVEVHAASINPIDWKIRTGYLKEVMPLEFPVTLGGDFAGVVSEIGPPAGGGVSGFKIGDEVFGWASIRRGGSGSLAQYVAVHSANTAFKPKSINFTQVAALPMVGVSSIQALEDYIKLKPGQKILIHGGAGGIGHIAIQIAKYLGAYVATTVSASDFEYVKSLGADEIIDYKNQAFENLLTDFDAVFDTVGGEIANKSFKVLKKGGILVSMLGQPDPKLAQKHGVVSIGESTDTSTKHLNRLTELVDNGTIKVHIDKIFPLEDVKEAFKLQEEGHPRSKVVLKRKVD